MIDLENHDYITLVECIGSAEKTILSILLISGVNILHMWCQHNDVDRNIVISKNETG